MKNKLISKRKVKKCQEGEILDQQMYTAGYADPVTVTASKKLNKRQQMQADKDWRQYLQEHPIEIGSDEYNRLPEKAKAQVYKNSVTNAIDKAALPTAVAIVAPTALTAGAASLVGSGALTAAADAAGKIGTKIAGTNLGQAASAFINNPYVNLGLTGLGAYFIPQHFKNGVSNIKTGNYIGALGDFGMIGLETLGAANTAKLLTNSVKGMVKPLFANPYSPNTLTRVIGTETSGLDDAVNSGIIRGNPNGGIQTARKLNRQQKILKEIGVPKKTIDNYMSNNLSEKDYEILKKYVPEWFSDTKTVLQVNGKSFSLGKRGLPTKYEDYIKEFRSANPQFKNKTNFNPQTEQEVLQNWEGVPEPTFALSPDLSKKYGFETENVLNSNLFKGDYAIQIKNAETHGTPLTLAGHLPEHWSLKYPMEYNHPDVTFYKRFGIPFINKNIYYKIDPLKYTTKKPLISKSIITDSKTGELLYTPDEIVNSGDFVKGKEVAVRFFEHPVVQESYKHNQQLARRLGITIPDKNPSQIVSQPVKVKYEDLGSNTIANVAQSYYGDPDAVISMNWRYYPLNTIRQGIIHENLHRGYYSAPLRPASLDKEYYNTIYKPEYIFWDWKTKKLLKPEYHNSYLADISGGEAGPNFIDLGRELGLKLGQKYPGYDKVIDMLNKYNGNKGFMIKQLNDSKAGMRHVWDAMTGKYFILPLIGGTTYYKLNNLNNEK